MTINQLKTRGFERHGKGWQSKLAHELGLDPRTIRYWLEGKNKIPPWLDLILTP